jgi:hypothetical protein
MSDQKYTSMQMGFVSPDGSHYGILGSQPDGFQNSGPAQLVVVSPKGEVSFHDANIISRGGRSGETLIETGLGIIEAGFLNGVLGMPDKTIQLRWDNDPSAFRNYVQLSGQPDPAQKQTIEPREPVRYPARSSLNP